MKMKRLLAIILSIAILAVSLPLTFMASAEDVATLEGPVEIDGTYTDYFTINKMKINDSNYLDLSDVGDIAWERYFPYGSYRYDSATYGITKIDDLGVNRRWPFFATKINVAEAGTYDITVDIFAKKTEYAKTLPIIVDGITYTSAIDLSQAQVAEATFSIKLGAGEHIVIFLGACPSTAAEAWAHAGGNSGNFPWVNFRKIGFAEGISLLAAPSLSEVDASINASARIEAEDANYTNIHGEYDDRAAAPAHYTEIMSKDATVGGVSIAGLTNSGVTSDAVKANINCSHAVPWVEYFVSAPADGVYNVRVGAYIGTYGDSQVAAENPPLPEAIIYANDTCYTSTYSGAWDTYNNANFAVTLKKGINIIRVVGPTADFFNDIAALGLGNKIYMNQDYLEIDSNLTALPVADGDSIKAGDEAYVGWSDYGDKGDYIGGVQLGDIRWDEWHYTGDNILGAAPTAENITLKYLTNGRAPHITFNTVAEEDGYYSMVIDAQVAPETFTVGDVVYPQTLSSTVAVFVDGVKYVGRFNNTVNKTKIYVSFYLEKGKHTVYVTSPIPENAAEYASFTAIEGYSANTYRNYVYNWMNMMTINCSSGMKLLQKYDSMPRYESENGIHNMYDNISTSAGGVKYSDDTTKTWEDLQATGIESMGSGYVQYAVKAPKDGTYYFRIVGSAGNNATITNNYVPEIVIGVGDSLQKFNYANTIDFSAELKAGVNYIKVTAPIKHADVTSGSAWFDQNYLAVDNRCTTVAATTITAADTTKAVFNDRYYYQENATTLGGAVTGDMNWANEANLATLTSYNLNRMPYVAVKVTAPEDGKYNVGIHVPSMGKTGHQQIAVLADGEVYKASFASRATSADFTGHTYIETDVYLTKGTHVIAFTAPLPLNAEDNASDCGNWFNINQIYVTNLTVESAPTRAEVETIEAIVADLDGDKKVDAGIAAATLDLLVNGTASDKALDLNGDKDVDICDLVASTKWEAAGNVIYVSDSGDNANTGAVADMPVKNLNVALDKVQDNGTIVVADTLTPDAHFGWAVHGKQVNITGGTLDLTPLTNLVLNDDVTFHDMTIWKTDGTGIIYANGHNLVMGEGLNTQYMHTADDPETEADEAKYHRLRIHGAIKGDSNLHTNYNVNVTLLSGDYSDIYGGRNQGSRALEGDINIVIGGTTKIHGSAFGAGSWWGNGSQTNTNGDVNITVQDDAYIWCLHGGANRAVVNGNVTITLKDNANVRYLYGGGRGGDEYSATVNGNTTVTMEGNSQVANVFGAGVDANSDVTGTITVNFGGNAKANFVYGGGDNTNTTGTTVVNVTGGTVVNNVFGGGLNGSVAGATVNFSGGTTEGIFGGCSGASMTGDVVVNATGGTVTRRIYGGCYNNYDVADNDVLPSWLSSHSVTGNVTLNLGEALTLGGSTELDNDAIFANSRYNEAFANENAVIVYANAAAAEKFANVGVSDLWSIAQNTSIAAE